MNEARTQIERERERERERDRHTHTLGEDARERMKRAYR